MDDGKTISNIRLARWLRSLNEVAMERLLLSGGGVNENGPPLWTSLAFLERRFKLAPSGLSRFIRPPLRCRIRPVRVGALGARTLDHWPMPRSYPRQQLR